MPAYRVTLIYQNIESGGSTRYRSTFFIESATGETDAISQATQLLGCNRDGKLYESRVIQTSSGSVRRHKEEQKVQAKREGWGIPCSED